MYDWMFKALLLSLGGALGTNARYWLGQWFGQQTWAAGFPLGTFVINVSGSFLLGVFAIVFLERMPPAQHHWFLLFGTGFCGGYTTFSTFSYETFRLAQDGSWWLVLLNVLGSVLAGFFAVVLAMGLAHKVYPEL